MDGTKIMNDGMINVHMDIFCFLLPGLGTCLPLEKLYSCYKMMFLQYKLEQTS